MGVSENIVEYAEQLEEENEELKDQLDSVVNDICNIINIIGESVAQSKCAERTKDCIETAEMLFGIIREYGDDNAQVNALERFSHLTGISLNE